MNKFTYLPIIIFVLILIMVHFIMINANLAIINILMVITAIITGLGFLTFIVSACGIALMFLYRFFSWEDGS
jgi:small-conductance mechanosensitive channel